MKHTIPLKRFEYCMPDTATTNFHLAKVNIDFEKGSLSLETDVKVNATIYPGVRVHLSDVADEEFVFCLEGIIANGDTINTCSGLLVLDSMINRNAPCGKEWHATIYLYDDYDDEREIKLRLQMCSLAVNAELN